MVGKKGQIAWNRGLTTKTNESLRLGGQKIGEANKRRIWTEVSKQKMSKSNEGKHIGKSLGNKSNLGRTGEKCYWLWKGGISFEPYTKEWTDQLKLQIRTRDNHTCQECGKIGVKCVHHINYDKKDCREENLITLCASCHSKTNAKRKYWQQHFEEMMKNSPKVSFPKQLILFSVYPTVPLSIDQTIKLKE